MEERLLRIAERLAERYRVEYFDIRISRAGLTSISLQNDRLEELSSNVEMGIGVRAFKSSWGFSSANDLSRAEEVIKIAIKIASLSSGSSRIYLGDPVRDDVEILGRKKVSEVDLEDKLSLVRGAGSSLEGDSIKNRSVHYDDSVNEQVFINSLGSEIRTVVSRVRLSISATAHSAGEMQQYWKVFGGVGGFEMVEEVDLSHWGPFVAGKAMELLKAASPPSGEFKVLMDPELTGVFIHEALGHAVEADSVKNGESILAGKLGEKIAVDGLTVVDDPTLPGKFGSYPYDDEGVKAKRVEIIKDGVLREYLTDRETSAVLGLEPNGHGRAQSYAHQPLVRMSNTYVEPGDWSFDEMVEELRNGLYMIGDKGGEVDIASGTFTFGAKEGYLVENGRITKHLRDVSLSGGILDVLRNVMAVGRDVRVEFPGYCGKGQWVPVDDGGPHLLTKATVGGLK
ncbi:TldD/PmbA family protein [Thermococcus zilligii]|uniref:TldD/PmbA family protein n=1 Tax=Thermococcus zilligii TaxID=54076 RepID=UPI00029AF754|nr:TldD/PmbA family protein [Thermococcus zilligii]